MRVNYGTLRSNRFIYRLDLSAAMTFPQDLDEEFSKVIMDYLYELTGLSVSLYLNNKRKTIYSNKNWPKFCIEVCRLIDQETCGDLYPPREGFHQCKAGLWCRTIPLKVNNTEIGYFSIGHKRLIGNYADIENLSKDVLKKLTRDDLNRLSGGDSNNLSFDELSLKTLNQLLEKHTMGCQINKYQFISLFDKVGTLNIEDFFNPFVDKLSIIEQDFINKNDQISDFKLSAAKLAHTFLLPIQSIVANAENLRNELTELNTPIEQINTADEILIEVSKLAFIAENIRRTLTSGKITDEIKFDKVDTIPLLNYCINLFKKEANKKGITLRDIEISDSLPVNVIEGSEPHLKLAFYNVIHNAVKYSFNPTRDHERFIDTVMSRSKGFCCIEVSNYGVGIMPEEIEKDLVFVEGYRGKLSRDKWRTGSGIGLAVVKQIIEAHEGFIEIASEKMGIGKDIDPYITTIKLYIPFSRRRNKHGRK